MTDFREVAAKVYHPVAPRGWPCFPWMALFPVDGPVSSVGGACTPLPLPGAQPCVNLLVWIAFSLDEVSGV